LGAGRYRRVTGVVVAALMAFGGCVLVPAAAGASGASPHAGTAHRLLQLRAFPSGWKGPMSITSPTFPAALTHLLPSCEKRTAPAPALPAHFSEELFTDDKGATVTVEAVIAFASASDAEQELRLYADKTAVRCLRGAVSEQFVARSNGVLNATSPGGRMKVPPLVTGVVAVKVGVKYSAGRKKVSRVYEVAVMRRANTVAYVNMIGMTLSTALSTRIFTAAAARLGS
jgi:hypothetical protein